MDLGEALVGAVGGGGLVALVGFARDLYRARRVDKAAAAKVEVAQLDAEQVTLGLLADRVRSLEADGKAERARCDEQIKQARKEVHDLRDRHATCEKRLSALDGEMRELRRSVERGEVTSRHGVPPKGEKR